MAEAAATDEGWFSRLNRWASRSFFDAAEGVFSAVGATDAARNLRHYRSGNGKDLTYTDDEAGRYAMIPAAEQLNRSRFESQVFTGNSKDSLLNSRLLNLRDGDEPYRFSHGLNRRYNFKPEGESWLDQAGKVASDIGQFALNPRTYPALGRFGVASDSDLVAQRKDNTLRLKGDVAHGFAGGNLFDFNPGQTGSTAAKLLEASGEATPYRLRFDRRQDVDAELQYEPDGRLTLRRATWGAIR